MVVAPQAPWFAPNANWPSGAYTKVHAQVGDTIDFYNIQFFNQNMAGTMAYSTCTVINCSLMLALLTDNLIQDLVTTASVWPKTSVMEIHSTVNVPLEKIVIGKPLTASDATNGGSVSLCSRVRKCSQHSLEIYGCGYASNLLHLGEIAGRHRRSDDMGVGCCALLIWCKLGLTVCEQTASAFMRTAIGSG